MLIINLVLLNTYDCGKVIDEVTPTQIANAVHSLMADKERMTQLKENCKIAAEIEHWDTDKQVLSEVVLRVFV